MDRIDLDVKRTIDEWRSVERELADEVARINTEYEGRALPDDAREDYAYAIETREQVVNIVRELERREDDARQLAQRDANREESFQFQTRRPSAVTGNDIYDLSTVRASWDNPVGQATELRDRAFRSVEQERFPETHSGFGRDTHEDKQGRVRDLIERLDRNDQEGEPGRVARLILGTGSPAYRRAFGKYISGKRESMTREEAAAAERAFTIGSTGNYPVPYTWDPTVTLTSNGAINPVRAISRKTQITGNTWYGVNSAGITAAYASEAAEASDGTPTLTQPSVTVERAQAFVPFSYEVAEDWAGLEAEMAREFADAKDILESSKFLSGLGHSSQQPEGLLVGATGTILSAATATFAVADLYSLRQALAPRWRARGSFVGNIAVLDKIRQFDVYGGSSFWVDLGGGNPARVLGEPIYEWSDMSSAVTTSSSSILTYGDFAQYHIVDRVGMSVRLIADLVGGSNNYPTGQSGLYAFWRNSADVNVAGAFKTLKLL